MGTNQITAKILAIRDGDYKKLLQGGEGKLQTKVWEENFCSPIIYAKSGGERSNLKISPLITQKLNIFCFFTPQGGAALKIFHCALLGGQKWP